MLSFNEIKTRLNKLLQGLIEYRSRQTEPFHLEMGPDEYGEYTSATTLKLNKEMFKSRHFREAVHGLLKDQVLPVTQEQHENTPETVTDFYKTLADLNAAFLTKHKYFSEEEFSENKGLIGKALAQMEQELNKFTAADASGDYMASLNLAKALGAKPQAAQQTEQLLPSISLADAAKKYYKAKEMDNAWKKESAGDMKNRLSFFLDFFTGRALSEISREEVRDFRGVLQRLPPQYKRKKELAGLPLSKVASMEHPKVLAVTTVNHTMETVSGFYAWCITEGLCIKNPAKSVQIKDPRLDVEKRDPFTVEHLKLIFAHPNFSEGKFASAAFFWPPLISLFTGMRLEEIVQLRVTDLYQDKDSGRWIFDINGDGLDEHGYAKRLKNKNAKRRIPVHHQLIEIGLLEYHTAISAKKNIRLFPQLNRTDKTVKYGKQPGKKFKEVVKEVLQSYERLAFHSFRHSFADFFKQRKLQSDMFTRLYGHGLNALAARQYGADFSVEVLAREVIDKLDYGLDLSGLVNNVYKKG